MKAIKLYILCLCLAACGKVEVVPGPAGPQGAAGPNGSKPANDTASVYGRVSSYNEFTAVAAHQDSVVITLHAGTDSLQTVSDTAGNYIIHGVHAGTYDLTYARPGYGTMKVFGLSHGGGPENTHVQQIAVVQRPYLTQPRNTNVTGIDSSFFGVRFYLYFELGVKYDDFTLGGQNFDIYVSKTPDPGPENYLFHTTSAPPNSYTPYSYLVTYDTKVLDKYFARGDSIYASVAVFSRYFYVPVVQVPGYGVWATKPIDGISYIDPATAETVWPFKGDPVYMKGIYTYMPK